MVVTRKLIRQRSKRQLAPPCFTTRVLQVTPKILVR